MISPNKQKSMKKKTISFKQEKKGKYNSELNVEDLKQAIQQEIETEGQKLYEAKNQMEILIENIKNAKLLKKRDIKALLKSKEDLTNKLHKEQFMFDKLTESPFMQNKSGL